MNIGFIGAGKVGFSMGKYMKAIIEAEPLSTIDYVKAVDGLTMQQTDRIEAPALVAMAVYIGKTRLIDNFTVE